jgi:hypothetical protein
MYVNVRYSSPRIKIVSFSWHEKQSVQSISVKPRRQMKPHSFIDEIRILKTFLTVFSVFMLSRFHSGWPDEFVKNRPKSSPMHFGQN